MQIMANRGGVDDEDDDAVGYDGGVTQALFKINTFPGYLYEDLYDGKDVAIMYSARKKIMLFAFVERKQKRNHQDIAVFKTSSDAT